MRRTASLSGRRHVIRKCGEIAAGYQTFAIFYHNCEGMNFVSQSSTFKLYVEQDVSRAANSLALVRLPSQNISARESFCPFHICHLVLHCPCNSSLLSHRSR